MVRRNPAAIQAQIHQRNITTSGGPTAKAKYLAIVGHSLTGALADPSLADPFYYQKKRFFQDIEKDLRGLSQCAWSHLKEELLKTLEIRYEYRGWQPLFDKFNQAKAYNHLSSIGCENIEFIPVYRQTGKKSRKTPDLQAQIGNQVLLCEVKTINISDDEARHRTEHSVRTIKAYLENGFFEKLRSTLMVAKDQMVAYRSEKNIRRVVYVVLNFDDSLHESEKIMRNS